MMQVKVRYFAVTRERAGAEEEWFELPEGATVELLWKTITEKHEALGSLLPHLRFAVNMDFVPETHPLGDRDEVALIPPVAGGAPRCSITTAPLDAAAVEALVERPEAGAIATFRGVVRNHSQGKEVEYLEYEAYPEMAQAKLEQAAREAEEKWPGVQVAVAHRYGKLVIGESAVVIAVSSPHRAAAFEACRYTIDRIKEIVPIWKKEVSPDGASWVGFGS